MGDDPWNPTTSRGRPDPKLPLPRLKDVDLLLVLKGVIGAAGRDAVRLLEPVGEVVANGVNNPGVALARLVTPKTPADAPQTITVPFAVQAKFEALRKAQHDEADRKGSDKLGRERCTTLVRDKATGELTQVNDVVATSGRSCTPNFAIDLSRFELVGMFHTHVNLDRSRLTPLDPPDPNVAFGGGDFRFQLEQKVPVSILQGATAQFMLVRTESTASITSEQGAALKDRSRTEMNEATGGRARIESNEDATLRIAKQLAAEHNLALYEGKDGTFTRTVPP